MRSLKLNYMILKNFKKRKVKMSLFLRFLIIITYPFLFSLISLTFGAMVVVDALQQYQVFKYIHNFYDYYSKLPQWTSVLNYGLNSFHLYYTAGSLGTFF